MKTFLVRSRTNYGEIVHIINADNENEARVMADSCKGVWKGYEIDEVPRDIYGVVESGGGDY